MAHIGIADGDGTRGAGMVPLGALAILSMQVDGGGFVTVDSGAVIMVVLKDGDLAGGMAGMVGMAQIHTQV